MTRSRTRNSESKTSSRSRSSMADDVLEEKAKAGDKVAARRLRNRQSAALSRKRQREYTKSLEDKVEQLQARVDELTAINAAVESDAAKVRAVEPKSKQKKKRSTSEAAPAGGGTARDTSRGAPDLSAARSAAALLSLRNSPAISGGSGIHPPALSLDGRDPSKTPDMDRPTGGSHLDEVGGSGSSTD